MCAEVLVTVTTIGIEPPARTALVPESSLKPTRSPCPTEATSDRSTVGVDALVPVVAGTSAEDGEAERALPLHPPITPQATTTAIAHRAVAG